MLLVLRYTMELIDLNISWTLLFLNERCEFVCFNCGSVYLHERIASYADDIVESSRQEICLFFFN